MGSTRGLAGNSWSTVSVSLHFDPLLKIDFLIMWHANSFNFITVLNFLNFILKSLKFMKFMFK